MKIKIEIVRDGPNFVVNADITKAQLDAIWRVLNPPVYGAGAGGGGETTYPGKGGVGYIDHQGRMVIPDGGGGVSGTGGICVSGTGGICVSGTGGGGMSGAGGICVSGTGGKS